MVTVEEVLLHFFKECDWYTRKNFLRIDQKGLEGQEENIFIPCCCVVWILCQSEKKIGENTASFPAIPTVYWEDGRILRLGNFVMDWEKLDLPKSRNNLPKKLVLSNK